MGSIAAFVGHSFSDNDRDVVRRFLDFFNQVKNMGIGFTWDHAETAEAKNLSQKVLEKMNGKNLFIGICTAKEQVIDPEKLKPVFMQREFLKAKQSEFASKTSDWILQKIGCAVGRDMQIMVLLEQGVQKPGGLQGDIEYIPFKRDEPSESFSKIMEMLNSLMGTKLGEEGGQTAKPEPPSSEPKPQETEQVPWSEPDENWTSDDYESALFMAIASGDQAKELELSDRYLKTIEGQKEYEHTSWQALRPYYHHRLKKEETLQELIELSRKNPSHDGVNMLLGRVYESYQEYEKAAECFKRSASNTESEEKKLRRLCAATVALSRQGDMHQDESLLKDTIAIAETLTDGEAAILEALTEIAQIRHDEDGFLAYSEGLLDKRPDDHDHRFALAYKYSELEENDLALYHYGILAKQKPTETRWNNLGVVKASLALSAKSVKAYRESEKLGGTLAMSNLAHKLISAGFLDEAKTLCDSAVKIENYDPHIGTAIARLKEVPEEEDKKEHEILEGMKLRRSFYAAYAHACVRPIVHGVRGSWKGPDCDLNVVIENGKMEASGSFEKEVPLIYWGSPPPSAKPNKILITIHYIGEVLGFGIRYKQWVHEGTNVPSTGTGPKKEGLMIISDDLTQMKVYEKGKRTEEKFYELIAMDRPDTSQSS